MQCRHGGGGGRAGHYTQSPGAVRSWASEASAVGCSHTSRSVKAVVLWITVLTAVGSVHQHPIWSGAVLAVVSIWMLHTLCVSFQP